MKHLPYFLLILLLALAATSGVSKTKPSDVESDRRKADYIFLEALRVKAQGYSKDATYELLSRAAQLNPDDVEIGMELASYLLQLSQGDSAMVADATEKIKRYYYAHPADYYEALSYGLLNENLGDRDEALKVWHDLHTRYPEKIELTYKYADYLSQGGDSLDRARAIEIYDSIEVIDGRSIPVSTRKIQIYYQDSDTQAIVSEIHKLLDSAPNSVDYNVFAGEIFAAINVNDSAIKYFNRACELDPSNGIANYSRAQFYNATGDSAAYDREVFQALAHDNLEIDTKLAILRSYIEKMYSDSLAQPRIDNLFEVLIDLHPHERDIHDMYARYLIVKKDYVQAAEQEELSLDLDPSDEEGWLMLSSLYFQVEDLDKAEESMKRAIKFFPENPELYLRIGSVRQQKEDYDEALNYYEKSKELADSTDLEFTASIYGSIADVLHKQDKTDEAVRLYETALKYSPDNYVLMNNYAYLLACAGIELEKALNLVTRSLEGNPDTATTMDTYAWVLFKLKDYAKAREVIDEVLPTVDDSAEVFEHAGDIYFMDGHPDEAVEFWEKALKLEPDNELLKRKVKNKTYFYK